MTKIGIVTLNGYNNFGNRLQNYALQKFLINNGFEVSSLWYKSDYNFKQLFSCIKKYIFNNKDYKREKKIKLFSKNNIKTDFIKDLKKIYYDYYVVGSDQVWNYNFKSIPEELRFLSFSKKDKNISYAASFGVDRIPKELMQKYKKGLSNFKAISLREKSGLNIIKQIDDSLNAEVVIDPTLLLSEIEWDNLINKKKLKIRKKYILCYFLGDDNYNKKSIIEFSKENNYEIINILDKNSKYYNIDPSDFVYLIKNAEAIFTDSFHAIVFSFIYNKPFVIYKREGMYSRIESFIKMFKLYDREYNKNRLISDYMHIDYNDSINILKIERIKAKEYLINNLKRS